MPVHGARHAKALEKCLPCLYYTLYSDEVCFKKHFTSFANVQVQVLFTVLKQEPARQALFDEQIVEDQKCKIVLNNRPAISFLPTLDSVQAYLCLILSRAAEYLFCDTTAAFQS